MKEPLEGRDLVFPVDFGLETEGVETQVPGTQLHVHTAFGGIGEPQGLV